MNIEPPPLPAPPVPPGTNVHRFHYMELDVRRLRDSRAAMVLSGDEFRAWFLLICASWHQVPAGSLPDNEYELAGLSGHGRDLKTWREIAKGALYGWKKFSDGRYYHPVVNEKVQEALRRIAKLEFEAERKRVYRENKDREKRGEEALPAPSLESWLAARGMDSPWTVRGQSVDSPWMSSVVGKDRNVERRGEELRGEELRGEDLKSTPLSSSRAKNAQEIQLAESRATPTTRVFDHWRAVFQHPKARLDEKRKRCIRNALKSGYSEDQLIEAISGAAKTPHNCGFNEQGQVYDAITLILRNADQIDRFIRNCHTPPKEHRNETPGERRTRANTNALQAVLDKIEKEENQ